MLSSPPMCVCVTGFIIRNACQRHLINCQEVTRVVPELTSGTQKQANRRETGRGKVGRVGIEDSPPGIQEWRLES